MELSKMGPPLKSSTATISRRRRPESFRAASGTAVESWLMTLSPPRCSRPLGPARFPSVLHDSPAVYTHDRIYCVPWRRRDNFGIRHYVDKATWREAFDHEAFHSWAPQGSAPRSHGPSP
ncbi:hypothetical protein GCM10010446_48150 [Streptomyces enissocaesilis]|uniref:Uncharacterized protein n=1 Tax=Streptomyces enissocaesilis TaxID=332589 RepID=A0ABN3XHQ5_9ACTN